MMYKYGNILRFMVENHLGGRNLPTPEQLRELLDRSGDEAACTPLTVENAKTSITNILQWMASIAPETHSCVTYVDNQGFNYTVWDRKVASAYDTPTKLKGIKKLVADQWLISSRNTRSGSGSQQRLSQSFPPIKKLITVKRGSLNELVQEGQAWIENRAASQALDVVTPPITHPAESSHGFFQPFKHEVAERFRGPSAPPAPPTATASSLAHVPDNSESEEEFNEAPKSSPSPSHSNPPSSSEDIRGHALNRVARAHPPGKQSPDRRKHEEEQARRKRAERDVSMRRQELDVVKPTLENEMANLTMREDLIRVREERVIAANNQLDHTRAILQAEAEHLRNIRDNLVRWQHMADEAFQQVTAEYAIVVTREEQLWRQPVPEIKSQSK